MRRHATAVAIAIGAHPTLAQDATSRRDSTERNTVAAKTAYTAFEGKIEAWTLTAVSLSHRDRRGSIILRGNVAERFGTTGS